MNKTFLKLLILLLCIFINVHVSASEHVLYDEDFENNSLTEIQNKWVANNNRVFSISTIRDGNTSTIYKYLYYSNLYSDDPSVQNSNPQKHLADGEYLTITINDLNINTSEYNDIRLNFDNIFSSTTDTTIKNNGLLVYTIDQNNIEHGPYYLGDYIPTGFLQKLNDDTYYRGFNMITQNLKDSNYIIKKIKIIPYGNLPRVCATVVSGDWRCQSKTFIVKEFKVIGYKSENYTNKNIVKKSININETRENIANRLLDLATLKWKPSIDMTSIHTMGGFRLKYSNEATGEIDYLYKAGQFYYGPLYTQRNRVLLEKLYSVLDNKVLNAETEKYYFVRDEADTKRYYTYEKPSDTSLILNSNVTLQSKDVWGDDCASSVAYSVAKHLPLTFLTSTTDFIWDRQKTTLLGNLTISPQSGTSHSVYEELYDDYFTKVTNNNLSSILKTSFETDLSRKLKSNDNRMWYLSFNSDDGYMKRTVAYSEMKSTTDVSAIDSDDPLTLKIENISLTQNKSVEVKFNYFINVSKNGTTTDERLDTSNIITKYCNSSNTCSTSTSITSSSITQVNSDYSKQTITITFTPTTTITKLEINPYGSGTKKGRLFRLEDLNIKLDNTNYYYNSATKMDAYFDLTNNVENSLIKSNIVDMINGTISNTEKNKLLAAFLASQDIYKGYKELKIGDIVSTHSKEASSHVRLVTGNTHVTCLDGTTVLSVSSSSISAPSGNCDSFGGIDPIKSYYIRTDINSVNTSTAYASRNYYGGLINSSDYTANWTPNSNYTDLKSGDVKGIKRSGDSALYLTNKNLNFYINTKNTFMDGLSKAYLPITLNDYISANKDEEYISLINQNTYSDIKNGFKGTIYSNYPIISLNYYFKNNTTGVTKNFDVYPNHSLNSKENGFSNYYSLYYNTPDEVQNSLRNTIGSSDDYEVRVGVSVGEKEDMEVFSLIPKRIKDFRVITPPNKLTYIQNTENLDLTGGVLRITYNDDTTDDISMTNPNVQVVGFDNIILGTQILTAKYEGHQTQFRVEVVTKQIASISMKTNPTKTTYIQNTETLDKTGGVVLITYNDNSTAEISLTNSNVSTTGFDNSTLGTNTITVTYSGKTTTFNVQIVAKQINSISMKNNPIKNSYIKNSETLDVSGGSILVTYNDNSTDEVSLTNSEIQLSGFDNTSVGTNTVTVTYKGKTTTFSVQIIDKEVTSISVKTNPTKMEYIQNHDQFDKTGGVLLVTYNDNSTGEVSFTNNSVEITGFDNSTIGNNTLTIKYGLKTTTLTIQIISKQITKIEMKELPLKKSYIVSKETLDKTGGIVLISYTDNSTDEISLDNENVEVTGFDNSSVGSKTITVRYLNFETTFNIDIVNKSVVKVELKTQPLKTYYINNKEDLDLTGGVMIVTYDDGSTEEISLLNQDVSVVSFTNKETGKQTVRLSYNGQIIEYEIEVISISPDEVVVNPKTGTIILKLIVLLLVTSITLYLFFNRKKLIKL